MLEQLNQVYLPEPSEHPNIVFESSHHCRTVSPRTTPCAPQVAHWLQTFNSSEFDNARAIGYPSEQELQYLYQDRAHHTGESTTIPAIAGAQDMFFAQHVDAYLPIQPQMLPTNGSYIDSSIWFKLRMSYIDQEYRNEILRASQARSSPENTLWPIHPGALYFDPHSNNPRYLDGVNTIDCLAIEDPTRDIVYNPRWREDTSIMLGWHEAGLNIRSRLRPPVMPEYCSHLMKAEYIVNDEEYAIIRDWMFETGHAVESKWLTDAPRDGKWDMLFMMEYPDRGYYDIRGSGYILKCSFGYSIRDPVTGEFSLQAAFDPFLNKLRAPCEPHNVKRIWVPELHRWCYVFTDLGGIVNIMSHDPSALLDWERRYYRVFKPAYEKSLQKARKLNGLEELTAVYGSTIFFSGTFIFPRTDRHFEALARKFGNPIIIHDWRSGSQFEF